MYHNNATSYESIVKSGVPQGSVLGPLLFIVFINDLADHISSSKILTFADDTKIIHPINSISDYNSLQADLNTIITWSKTNNLMLNQDKFELISHNSKIKSKSKEILNELPFSSNYESYNVGDDLILSSTVVRDLGLFINSNLNWEDHIDKLCCKGKQLSG